MSRQADTLFCKIAITAGMVSQQQAQKVLAFVEKREQETGRRPIVAAVFTKHQLMTAQQVQKVKAAVSKRLGEAAPLHRPVSSGRSGGGGRGRRRGREKPAKRPVDQQTLVMGAGFGVVFVGVLITICYLYLVGGGSEVSSSGSGKRDRQQGAAETRMGISEPEDELSPIPEDKDLPREYVLDLSQRLSDVQLDRIDNPARAQSSFQKVKEFVEESRSRGYIIPADIEIRLRETEEGLAAMAAEAEDEFPVEDAPPTEEPTAAPPAKETDPGDDEDDIDLDDLEDLDDL